MNNPIATVDAKQIPVKVEQVVICRGEVLTVWMTAKRRDEEQFPRVQVELRVQSGTGELQIFHSPGIQVCSFDEWASDPGKAVEDE